MVLKYRFGLEQHHLRRFPGHRGVSGSSLLMVMVPVVRLIVASLTLRKGTLAAGFAAGLLAMLLHALVDFNFHIPANAAIASVLAGVVMGLPWKSQN